MTDGTIAHWAERLSSNRRVSGLIPRTNKQRQTTTHINTHSHSTCMNVDSGRKPQYTGGCRLHTDSYPADHIPWCTTQVKSRMFYCINITMKRILESILWSLFFFPKSYCQLSAALFSGSPQRLICLLVFDLAWISHSMYIDHLMKQCMKTLLAEGTGSSCQTQCSQNLQHLIKCN